MIKFTFREHALWAVLNVLDIVTGSEYIKTFRQLEEQESYSLEDLRSHEEELREEILRHASKEIPYYSKRAVSALSIENFPVITKTELRQNLQDFICERIDINSLYEQKSSGSTGLQTTVYFTKKELSKLRACQIYWWYKAGYKLGTRTVQLGINKRTTVKKIKDFLFNVKYYQAWEISEALKEDILGVLKGKNIFVGGYASALNQLTTIADTHEYRVIGAVSWGEKLFEQYKTNFNERFNVVIQDTYGSSEGFMIAVELSEGLLSIQSNFVYVEILDDNNRPLPKGQIGNIVVTSYVAHAFPLIRYKIGDLGIMLPNKEYPDNYSYPYPILKTLVGRESDVVHISEKSIATVHSFTGIMEFHQYIKEYQIVQSIIGRVQVLCCLEKEPKGWIAKLKEGFKEKIPNLEVEITVVNEIPRYASGKPQIIRNNLNLSVIGKNSIDCF